MIAVVPTQSGLLNLWESGERELTGRRALLLLASATSLESRDLNAMSIGRRDSTILDLRENLFGSRFVGVTDCPSCGEEIELSFDAIEVRRDVQTVDEVEMIIDGVAVQFRLPNAGDVVSIENATDIAEARDFLIARCILGASRNNEQITVDDLSPSTIEAITDRMRDLDPQADVTLDVDCPSCSYAWKEPFDIVSFLWRELRTSSRRLLNEIHLLASAYGWTEEQILALTPTRRNTYVEIVQSATF